ncbi:hypothetical protein GWI33_003357 [Rhynchophorus ferrugineus]|uniref:Uncharacterized protein n=1 Tax=Rhynchophorus ferrugineus TaxID=354439 RepID=A0A834IVD8_RHYFE|nr:hypothetical protein GWI33_003357 [Rhynchophorus ferrugineus]
MKKHTSRGHLATTPNLITKIRGPILPVQNPITLQTQTLTRGVNHQTIPITSRPSHTSSSNKKDDSYTRDKGSGSSSYKDKGSGDLTASSSRTSRFSLVSSKKSNNSRSRSRNRSGSKSSTDNICDPLKISESFGNHLHLIYSKNQDDNIAENIPEVERDDATLDCPITFE